MIRRIRYNLLSIHIFVNFFRRSSSVAKIEEQKIIEEELKAKKAKEQMFFILDVVKNFEKNENKQVREKRSRPSTAKLFRVRKAKLTFLDSGTTIE